MQSSVIISIVSLVLASCIAFITLMVAVHQAILAFLGTAEGYRRCRRSVIGPWAQYRDRKWRWGEFRNETLFTTPDIRLLTVEEGQQDLETALKSCEFGTDDQAWCTKHKCSWKPGTGACEGLNKCDMIDIEKDAQAYGSCAPAERPVCDILDRRHDVPKALCDTFELHHAGAASCTDQVTWNTLLRSLHDYQHTAAPNTALRPDPVGHSCQTGGCKTGGIKYAVHQTGQSDSRVAVCLRQRSWDFVPSDLIRPFATSTVGGYLTA
jgi:hypothetical protein